MLAAVIVSFNYNTNKLLLCCFFLDIYSYVQIKIVVSIFPGIRKVFDIYKQLLSRVKQHFEEKINPVRTVCEHWIMYLRIRNYIKLREGR